MKKTLYISGIVGLATLAGAGCTGVKVDPAEGWDEQTVYQYRPKAPCLWGVKKDIFGNNVPYQSCPEGIEQIELKGTEMTPPHSTLDDIMREYRESDKPSTGGGSNAVPK